MGEPGSSEVPHASDVESGLDAAPWSYGGSGEVAVDVLVDAVVAPRCVHQLGEEVVVDRREDGSIVMRLPVSDTEALRSWVLDMGDRAEILAPAQVRDDMANWLRAIARSPGTGAA